MTGTPCQSAALDRIFAPWTAKIAEFLHTIVKTILTIAEIVRTTLDETMGRHARLLHHRTGFLPPSASALHADIGVAPARITDNHKVDPDVSLSAQIREAWQATSPQVLLDRGQEEQPAEANGDDGEGKLMDLEELEGHDTGSARQTRPHVKCSRGFVNPLSATEH